MQVRALIVVFCSAFDRRYLANIFFTGIAAGSDTAPTGTLLPGFGKSAIRAFQLP